MFFLFFLAISEKTREIELSKRVGTFIASYNAKEKLRIKISTVFTSLFIKAKNLKGMSLSYNIDGIKHSYNDMKWPQPIIGFDFGNNTGEIEILFSRKSDIRIDYAIFDDNCNDRLIFNTIDPIIDLDSNVKKKICYYNAIGAPLYIDYSKNFTIEEFLIINQKEQKISANKMNKVVENNPVFIIMNTLPRIEKNAQIAFLYDSESRKTNVVLNRSKYDTSFMLFAPDNLLYNEQYPYKIETFFIIVILTLGLIEWIHVKYKFDSEERMPLISNDQNSESDDFSFCA